MTLRCCLKCGEPTTGPRCPEHTTDAKGTATARGYNSSWDRLSKRARRLQPFCSLCMRHCRRGPGLSTAQPTSRSPARRRAMTSLSG